MKGKNKKPREGDLFKNASSISITRTKIAMTRKKVSKAEGVTSLREERKYVDKTPANLARAQREIDRRAKKVSVDLN